MGEDKQQPGFTLLEIIFVLVLMGAFAACFTVKPFRFEEDVVYKTKIALSEAVFLARLRSMASDTPIVLSLTKENELEIKKGYWDKKYSKRLDPKISKCSFVDFPFESGDSDYPKTPFKAGQKLQEKVIFEEKIFLPFQLKFSLNGKEWYISVDINAQTQVYLK